MEGATETAVTGMGEVIKTALSDAGSSTLSYVNDGVVALLPSAASIMALLLGLRLAFSFFKSIAN